MNIFKLLCQKCGHMNDQTYKVSQKIAIFLTHWSKISLFQSKIFSRHQKLKFSCKMSIFCPMGQKRWWFLFWSTQLPMVRFLRLKITHYLKTRFLDNLYFKAQTQPPCMLIAYSYDLNSKFTIKHYLMYTNNTSWHLFYQGLYGFYNFIIFMHVNQYRQ